MGYVAFAAAVYLVLAAPLGFALWFLVRRLRASNLRREGKIAVFTASFVLFLSPVVVPLATILVGVAPLAWFLLAVPFDGNGLDSFPIQFALAPTFQSTAVVATIVVSNIWARRLFPNNSSKRTPLRSAA